jgi:hypothetical protein
VWLGCSSEHAGPADGASPAAADLGTSVTASARPVESAVSVVVDVSVAGADWVQIRALDDQSETDTPRLAVTGSPMAVPLFGLSPGATTRVQVTAGTHDGATVAAPELRVDTPPLPDGFPSLQVTSDDEITKQDALLLSLLRFDKGFSAAAIVDRAGRLLWYRLGGAPSPLGFDFQSWSTEMTLYQSGWQGFERLDFVDGVVGKWTISTPLGLDGHDLVELADGHALVFQRGTHLEDTRPFVDGGVAAATVDDVTVTELDGAGGETTRWHSWPSIQLDEVMPDINLAAPPIDALHPNSLQVLSGGDLLISLRHTDSVLRVDGNSGQIRWRLGGARSDFRFVNDPLNGFSHQHFARMLDNGDLLLLDNGNLHAPPVSRVVEYRLDEAAHTATLVWEYRHEPDLYDSAAGSAERLADGDTLVSWGIDGVVSEVDPFAEVQWELQVPGCMVYRALVLSSLY